MPEVRLTLEEYMELVNRGLAPSERVYIRGKQPVLNVSKKPPASKKKRKASAYSKKYGRAFKKVAPKYKKKNGGWKAGGFKAAQRAAHKMAKRMK